MKTLFVILTTFTLSSTIWVPAGIAWNEKRPVSAQDFYEQSGFAHYELRGAQP